MVWMRTQNEELKKGVGWEASGLETHLCYFVA